MGGLITSTPRTLFVLPTPYAWFERDAGVADGTNTVMPNLHAKMIGCLIMTGSTILTGCKGQVHRYEDSYTRDKPVKANLVGVYIETDRDSNSTAKVTLMGNGSMSAIDIPQWIQGKDNTWHINRFKSFTGHWTVSPSTGSEEEGGRTEWFLKFTNVHYSPDRSWAGKRLLIKEETSSQLTSASLLGVGPPYTIVFEFDDDGDVAVELARR